jgi:hypothetical protein
VKNLDEIEHTDIFNIPLETKKILIQNGAEMLWEQCRLTSTFTGEKMSFILNKSLGNLEMRIRELKEEEQYELCYFLNEVIWAVHKKIQDNRKDKPIF